MPVKDGIAVTKANSRWQKLPESELWERYRLQRDPMIREYFVKQYAPLVKYVAGRVAIGMPSAVDFDDLLLKGVELLECSERTRAFAVERFRHVLVDEYQDTNRIQCRLLRLLAPHGNVFVVGDEDQSIFNFRGADLRNILDFERDFPAARLVKLEVNYRSTGSILRVASAVIANNKERKGKRLRASLDEGKPPKLFAAEDERDEAAFVALRLTELRKEQPASSCAILLRTHAQKFNNYA